MEPRKFDKQAAQGDILVRRITALPDDVEVIEPEKGYHVIAHSETGHHHAIEARHGVRHMRSLSNPLISYVVLDDAVKEAGAEAECLLVHYRDYDTHAPIALSPGIHEIRRQRERDDSVLAGWRRVED